MKQTSMKLYFEGAAGSVTGSCSRLEYSCGEEKAQILVDCGLLQEAEEGTITVPDWSFEPSQIHAVLLTHAHIDHCGALPLLYNRGFSGKVYATDATIELATIMLADIAKTTQFFEKDDIDKIRWESVDSIEEGRIQGRYFGIFPNIRACFMRSSHILGATGIYVQWFKNVAEEGDEIDKNDINNFKTIFFSGDVGRNFDGINDESTFLKPNFYPFTTAAKEFFVLESTYGNRLHTENTDYRAKIAFLEQTLKKALAGNGYAVIPAFALDRTQTVLADVYDVLQSKKIIEEKAIDRNAINEEIKKIKNDSSIDKKERKAKTAELQAMLSNKKTIKVHSVSPLGNLINKVYAKNLGTESKVMDAKGKIRFRYLNKTPFIPPEYQNEQNQNAADTVSDEAVQKRASCLISLKSDKESANDFCFQSDVMFEQKKVGAMTKSLPKSAGTFALPQSIIVGASGMCDRGFIKDAVEKALADENATIILTGYTPKGSAGEVIKRFANGAQKAGFTKQELFNKKVPSMKIRLFEIKANIVDMSDFYSAHADQAELLTYLFDNPEKPRTTPVQVFLNHGSIAGGLALAEKIDAFNARLGENTPKAVVTSPFCNAFDLTGERAELLVSAENIAEHEKLVAESRNVLNQPAETVFAEEPIEEMPPSSTAETDEMDKLIREKIFHGKDFLLAGFDILPLALERIREIARRIDISEEENQKKIHKAIFALRSEWQKETKLNPMLFSSPKTVSLKKKLASTTLFTAENLTVALGDCDISAVAPEILRLDEIYQKRAADELYCKMPYTLSIPKKIDSFCRNLLSSLIQTERELIVREFVNQRLSGFNPFPAPLSSEEKISEDMKFVDEIL